MSEYAIKRLDATTWDAYACLLDKHNGCGFGGCWCTWFHSREGRPAGEMGRPWKERLVREGYPQDTQGEKISARFLYNTTRSLYAQTGFTYLRPTGKNHCVMRRTVSPA